MSDAPPRARAAGRWAGYGSFVAWTAIGAGVCVAWLSPLTIALAVLVAVVVAAAVLVGRPGGVDAGVTGLLSGPGMVLLVIAFLNRDGPGEVCKTSATGHHCTSAWSPWPWVVVGVLLVVGGVVLVAAGALLFRQAVRGRDDPDQGASAVGAGPVAPGASPG
jgi:hypothetical protein